MIWDLFTERHWWGIQETEKLRVKNWILESWRGIKPREGGLVVAHVALPGEAVGVILLAQPQLMRESVFLWE